MRVIGSDGEMIGVLSRDEALRMAEDEEFDLVEIQPNADPPVCKIMDYGKYRFEQAKREKEARKNQRVVEIKEIRLTPNIDIVDLNTKVKNACRFLQDGNKVKVSVRFRGREVTHASLGQDLLHRFAELCSECSTVEKQPKLEGRQMLMFLAPAKDK